MSKLSIDALHLSDKRVLMRVDFNVPLTEDLSVSDDTRIKAALPSIQKIIQSNGKAVLMSHLGRPKGQVNPSFSLSPVASTLSNLLGKNVIIASDCVGSDVEDIVSNMNNGDVILLENLRFHKEETDNDSGFAKKLSKLGDLYINDAFGTAHRAHASTVGVTKYFDQCAAGYLMQKELENLGNALENPARPFVAIMGGAKISGKIELVQNLLSKVDMILIGGGMAYTFFKAQGLEVGKSLVEEDKIELAGQLLEQASQQNIDVALPVDSVIAQEISDIAETKVVSNDAIPKGWMGVDIGPATIESFRMKILAANTVVWNGPLGVFEKDAFAKGTIAIAHILAEATESGATTIIGGGDSAAAVKKAGFADKVTHVSTGGGASMEFLSGITLPGVAALTDV